VLEITGNGTTLTFMDFPRHVTAAVLARLLSVNKSTVSKLTAKRVFRKTPRGFDVVESIAAHCAHTASLVAKAHGEGAYGQARTSLVKERIASARLNRLEKEGKLVHVNTVADMWGKIFVVVRTAFMRLPVTAAPRLTGLKLPMQAQQILDPMVRDILQELPQELEIIVDSYSRR
jgi:phage terminase Nu1 subunit (DNA packaging protein)